MLVSRSSPFGGKTRTLVLLALHLMEESYARELSRVLDLSLYGIQKAIKGLEIDGLLAGRSMGRTRVYRLNPRYFAKKELTNYLKRLAESETILVKRIAFLRKRPRRTGKPL